MLLVCPSCRTRYVVPDSAIGAAGRQVRCANCRNSWFQEGPSSVPPPRLEPIVQQDLPPTLSSPVSPSPVSPLPVSSKPAAADDNDTAPEPGFSSLNPLPPTIETPPLAGDDSAPAGFRTAIFSDVAPERSQFAHEPPFRPRRNPAKLLTYAAIVFAASVAIIGGALYYSGWLEDSFAISGKESNLTIDLHDNLDLGRAADGSPYFIASGTIVNPTAQKLSVPNMLVTLKDASGRSIFNWEMKPPVRSLAPGATVEFSQLKRDVPLASSKISVVWILGS